MSADILNHECRYMLKFTSELTLRCEDRYIQKGRNHHVTALIGLNSIQMSIIFMTVYLYRWKVLRSTNPETSKVWLFIRSTANQRAAQNNYQTLGFQDLYFLNFVTCTRNNITGDTLKCQVKWMVSRNETFPSRDSRLVSKKCGSLQRVRNREGNLASFSKGPTLIRKSLQ